MFERRSNEDLVLQTEGGALGTTGNGGTENEPLEDEAVCPAELTDFSKIGVLVRNNPGLEKDVWHLIYEEPGKPALTMPLTFADCSICQILDAPEACESLSLENGTRVSVTGISGDGDVLVKTLITE